MKDLFADDKRRRHPSSMLEGVPMGCGGLVQRRGHPLDVIARDEFDHREVGDTLVPVRQGMVARQTYAEDGGSKHVLGVMNQMAFEIDWAVDHAGGVSGTSMSTI
jgi:hypothetical protein